MLAFIQLPKYCVHRRPVIIFVVHLLPCRYRGRRRADSRTYAIKVTDLEALTPWSRAAAVREAQVLAALTGRGPGGFRHPCIATFREAFCLQSRLCIVTDPAPGGDLKRLLE